jgi:hypothetical protein
MGYPGKGLPMPGGEDNDNGMPDFGGEKGMKNLFDSMFTPKPRREDDPNRKVGKKDLYGRLNMDGQSPNNQ